MGAGGLAALLPYVGKEEFGLLDFQRDLFAGQGGAFAWRYRRGAAIALCRAGTEREHCGGEDAEEGGP